MPQPRLLRLAIIGSTELAGHPAVWPILRRLLEEHRPTTLVSGDAPGVDSMAAKVAIDMGIPVVKHLPEVHRWDGGDRIGFKQRNLRIARDCDLLVLVVQKSSRTGGDRWTRDKVKALGKPVYEVVIDA